MVALVILVIGSSIVLGTAATALGLHLTLRFLERGAGPVESAATESPLLTKMH
jgi:hypothetical protein